MLTNGFAHLLPNILVAIFAITGTLNLAGSRYVRARFRKLRHPSQFYRAMGTLQLIASLLLTTPHLQIWGVPLAGLLTFFWIVTLLDHRQWNWAAAGMLVMAALVPASFAVY